MKLPQNCESTNSSVKYKGQGLVPDPSVLIQEGPTCIFFAIVALAIMQLRRTMFDLGRICEVHFDARDFIKAFVTKYGPLCHDHNPRSKRALKLFMEEGIKAYNLSGNPPYFSQSLKIKSFTSFPPVPDLTQPDKLLVFSFEFVASLLKEGIPVLGSFPVRVGAMKGDYIHLGDGIYDCWPSGQDDVERITHAVTFVDFGKHEGRPYLKFVGTHGMWWGKDGFGKVYFDGIYQRDDNYCFHVISFKETASPSCLPTESAANSKLPPPSAEQLQPCWYKAGTTVLGIEGYPIEIQALFFMIPRCTSSLLKDSNDDFVYQITKSIRALSYHLHSHYWLDFRGDIYCHKTEEYSQTALKRFDVIPESLTGWIFDFMTRRGGDFIGYVFWATGHDDGGGSCTVAWSDVCHPTELGGLGVLDIKRMSWALRVRWPWLGRTDDTKPWASFPIKSSKNVQALVHAAAKVQLGNGNKALIWSDRWLAGQCIADLASDVLAAVSTHTTKARKVVSALPNNAWIKDISGALTSDCIIQFLNLVDILSAQQISPDSEDEFIWHLVAYGEYTTKSAYTALFEGTVKSPHDRSIMEVLRAVHLGRAHGFSKLNRALVTLLPKKQDATEIKDFRSISLVHSIAKLIAKTMSLRLPLPPTLISPSQNAFIHGRTIHDNFMLVQQMAKSFHAANSLIVLLKLDIARAFELLRLFGVATDLHTNILKKAATPICCSDEQRLTIAQTLHCPVKDFPIVYLGVPLSIWKLRAEDLQPLIDKLHDKLSGWPAGLLSKGDKLVLIKSVLSAAPIHTMLATDMPKLIKDAIIRGQRSFFWSSGRDDGGGSCAVAWKDVCHPVEYGGLGVLDLKRMGWALCARWAWLRRSDDSCPWTNFPVHLGRHVEALVYAATTATLGNGTKLLFWSDRWLAGQSIADLAPAVVAAVNPRVMKRRSVASALPENAGIRDITGTLSTEASIQFLHLVDITAEQELHPGSQDTLTWNLTESGSYSAKSAYKAFFQGSTFSPHHNSIWECWSPLKCKVFAWQASLDRCWTAERRKCHDLDDDDTCALCDQEVESISHLLSHDRCWTAQHRMCHGLSDDDTCVLCDQEAEPIAHLMTQCTFSQQIWHDICSKLNLQSCMPDPNMEFTTWFETAVANSDPAVQKGARSVIILTMWRLWKTRNNVILKNLTPNRHDLAQSILDEAKLWLLAGPRALRWLPLHSRPPDEPPGQNLQA